MASGVLREAAEFTYVDASVGSRVPQEGVLCAFSWRHSAGKSRGGRRGAGAASADGRAATSRRRLPSISSSKCERTRTHLLWSRRSPSVMLGVGVCKFWMHRACGTLVSPQGLWKPYGRGVREGLGSRRSKSDGIASAMSAVSVFRCRS